MHFKRLRLNGFKSFVDPTELIIHQGVTGIVGPNGCGKSNLLEALRWVMGESSAKSMRGNDMDDVIFAGTDRRSARPYAEVILTIDNSDFLAPAQFNTEETLEISRKITRDMGSTYRVNGKEVRARDLQILFADAATGSNSPALVRQGQINQLIHAKPKQRRVILEEAAGIGGLYSRRHEAELRLRAASVNLERVEDILKQTESQINTLRRQSKQAEKYKILSSDIRKTEALLLSVLYQNASNDRLVAEKNLRDISALVAQADIKISELTRREMDLQEQVAPLREEFAIASAILKRVEIESATIITQLNEAESRIHRLNRAKENITAEHIRETELLSDAKTYHQRIKDELSDMTKANDDSPQEMIALQTRLDIGNQELSESEQKLEQYRTEISQLQSKNQSLNENVNQARLRKSRLDNDFISISSQEEQAKNALLSDFSTDIFIEKQTELHNILNKKTNILKELESNIVTLRQNEDSARKTMMDYESKVQKLSAEIKGLLALTQHAKKGTAHTIEQIDVVSGYEKALGVVFGDDISFDDNENQPRYWRTLPQTYPISGLPADFVPLRNYIRSIPEFLSKALDYVGIVSETDGDSIQKTLPVGASVVSVTGKLWRWDGFVISDGSHTQAAVMLEQKNRLLSLGDILKQSDIDFKQSAQHYQNVKNQHSHTKIQEQNTVQDIKNYQKQSQDLERKIYDIQNNRKIAETKMDSIAQRRILIERELTESTQILNKALDDLSKISGTDHLKEQAEALKLQVTQKRMSLSDARSLLETHRRSANERANRFKLLQKDLGGWQDRMTKANERIMDCEKRLVSIQKEQEQIADLPEKLKLKSENAKQNIALAQTRFDTAKNASEGLEGELSIITKTLREDTAESAKLRETKVRYEAYQEMSLLKEHDILQKIQDKKDSTPPELHAELEQYPDEHTPHIQDIEDKLKQLTRERDALGAVNLIAHTQLTEIEEQSLTLINEKNDLLLAIKKLSTAIHDINKDGRIRMLKAFDIVNSNFKRLFQHLFSGGTAELQLIESDDPLEAGLEVAACPPGKKTNSLTLLSGGEQALTCMALIFAVFLTNPSPICVLDEVDAPLDDANVERYCNMIQEMTKMTDTRFLVITHHALTMARTDRLFGVTMAERGVSQLVSVDLQAAEKLLTDVMA